MNIQAVTRPRVSFELARPDDDAELRALLRETPMGERIEVAFLREPDFFRAARVQGTCVQVIVARAGGRIAGVATRALRAGYLNGRAATVGYLGDLRLRSEFRGGTVLARGYRFLRDLHADGRAELYTTVIVEDNRRALKSVAANRAGLPLYTDLGRILTPAIHVGRPLPALNSDIVRGSADLLPDIVAKLNENRLQFALAYTESDFLDGRFPGFRVADFHVLRRGGRVAGVLGAWDTGSFRQTVVTRYRGALGALRPLVNLFRRPPLPPPGRPLRHLTLSFISTDDGQAMRALVRHAYREAAGGAYTHLTLALHERDPRAELIGEYPHTPFAGRLFAVTFDGVPRLDGRVPCAEAALL